jgi:hypothetical protein
MCAVIVTSSGCGRGGAKLIGKLAGTPKPRTILNSLNKAMSTHSVNSATVAIMGKIFLKMTMKRQSGCLKPLNKDKFMHSINLVYSIALEREFHKIWKKVSGGIVKQEREGMPE